MTWHSFVSGFTSTTFVLSSLMVYSVSNPQPTTNTTQQVMYVTPNRSISCSIGNPFPCLTFTDYVLDADKYFVNDSTFVFSHDNHILNTRLQLAGIHNISFKGLPDRRANIQVINHGAGIIWESCKNVEISNIIFYIESNFTYILSFELTFPVKLSNITILGNGHAGCSSIISERSRVDISNSMFVEIIGYSGAALIASESTVAFVGNNYFSKNNARSGGALSLHDSTLLFSGNISFVGNSVGYVYNNDSIFCKTHSKRIGRGGAIYCVNSTLFENSVKGNFETSESAGGSDFKSFSNCFAVNHSYMGATGQSSQYCVTRSSCNGSYILFLHNSASNNGGAICTQKSTISFGKIYCRNIILENNSAIKYVGGAIALSGSSSMQLCGHVSFIGNSATSGGAIITLSSNISFGLNCSTKVQLLFINNTAIKSGGALFSKNGSICSDGGSAILVNNSAHEGGAIFSFKSNISLDIGYCNKNSTTRNLNHILLFRNNTAAEVGGALSISKSVVSLNNSSEGDIILDSNFANFYGGAIALTESSLQFCGSVSIVNNKAGIGGAIHITTSIISLGMNCSATNMNVVHTGKSTKKIKLGLNRAINRGGAIASYDSQLYFMENVVFHDNLAEYGGAMFLDVTSKVLLKPMLCLWFIQNVADKMGGAIYYYDSSSNCDNPQKNPDCFISFSRSTPLKNISLLFDNNSASSGGALLYVGKLGNCNHYSASSVFNKCKIKNLMNVSKIITNNHQTLLLADAENIIFCQHEHDQSVSINSAYPGQTFNVMLAAFGPASLNTSTTISYKSNDSNDERLIVLRQVQLFVEVNNTCTNVSYYVKDVERKVTVQYKLYHSNPCDSLVDGVKLIIDVKPCPLGFQLSRKEEVCACDERLQRFTQTCDINTLSLERSENTFWISKQPNDSGFVLHKSGCPFDLCKDKFVSVSLSDPDVQCQFNRSGTLCGQCKENYSLSLATLHCIKCTKSNHVALVLPFALVGIFLVILILLLHFTVDVGTLNGLIFYVNIVHSNRQVFLPYYVRESSNFLTVFISWLNLDFGIETCFYDGMNIYAYSWLQFVFPFYIWFLIGAIIFVSRYSKRMSKSLGQNPVAALATLLFVSYSKILNAIITPLSLTHLAFVPNNRSSLESTYSVWLYDGSVDYFKDPKHIVLGLFAILTLLVVFLPYTFLLLCGHWLMAYSDKCFLSWLNRIKPFMDVYYAPFKKKTRYWIGLILLSRSMLLLTIAINAIGSDYVNILVTASVTAGLLFIKGKVYEHNYNDFLESSFIFNLCVLSIATAYLKGKSPQSQYAVSSASIAISFMTFVGILLFHIYLQLKSTSVWRDCFLRILCLLRKCIPTKDRDNVVPNDSDLAAVTSTIVELREPLLDNDEA